VAGAQYKNYKNFCNLLFHKKDFYVEAEWHFFATSHEKRPCDGIIGGTVKRMARRASLQGGTTIQTPQALFEWCTENLLNIKSFFVSSSDIDENKRFLESRFDKAKTIPGRFPFIRSPLTLIAVL
jgi:hypothetical protein